MPTKGDEIVPLCLAGETLRQVPVLLDHATSTLAEPRRDPGGASGDAFRGTAPPSSS